jgi:hypothetical protein
MGSTENSVWLYDGTLDGTTIAGAELWQDVSLSLGPGWTEPLALPYACDGTQASQTEATIDTGLPALVETPFQVSYTVTGYVSGSHAIGYGSPDSLTSFQTGDGVFTDVITPDGVGSLARVVGDAEFIGTISDVKINEAPLLGGPIEFQTLTSFQPPNGDHTNEKRVGFVRTIGYLAGTATLNVKAVFDYELDTIINAPASQPVQGFNIWDNAIWNKDLWDYGASGASYPVGALGMGRVVAIAIRGSSATRLNFVGWDISYTVGRFL